MTPEQITNRIKKHNALQIFMGIVLIPASCFLWWSSFWFFRWGTYFPISIFRDDAWSISFIIAWLCMIPLAFEGARRTRPLFDMDEYANSNLFNNELLQSDTGQALSWYYGNPAAGAYVVTQILYAAPQTMVTAIKSLRSLMHVNAVMLDDASRIIGELKQIRKWVPAENYKDFGTVLFVLDRLDLIWMEDESGQLEIRFPVGDD